MGMTDGIAVVWGDVNRRYMDGQKRMHAVTQLSAISRVLRLLLQSGVLGLGAYLVVQGEASGGVIIAASILSARALAPVDQMIANWKNFVSARQGWKRLSELMKKFPVGTALLELPRPERNLNVRGVAVAPPGTQKVVVQDVSFSLVAGAGLGIVGPSGSGKSSLSRALVGVWRPARGKVELDGASIDFWRPEIFGRYVGYLPQDVELFEGTVAQNISRFDPEPDSAAILAAAKAAGVHEVIIQLPQGYQSEIGESGSALSGGQRQRIALARALYKDPFLVVLDEPNSNLDLEGERALTQAIASVRARKGIIIVVAHRQSALAAVDQVLLLRGGRAVKFGPRDEVMEQLTGQKTANLKVVAQASTSE